MLNKCLLPLLGIPNIAFNKTAKQKGNGGSSSDEENPDRSGNAVDGDFYNSCSRTKKTHDPWWTVNIEGWFVVRTVVILPTEKFGGMCPCFFGKVLPNRKAS